MTYKFYFKYNSTFMIVMISKNRGPSASHWTVQSLEPIWNICLCLSLLWLGSVAAPTCESLTLRPVVAVTRQRRPEDYGGQEWSLIHYRVSVSFHLNCKFPLFLWLSSVLCNAYIPPLPLSYLYMYKSRFHLRSFSCFFFIEFYNLSISILLSLHAMTKKIKRKN